MVTDVCVILGVCPPLREIEIFTSFLTRRHISSVFPNSFLLFSYIISLRISWGLTVQEILTLGMIQNEKGWWITLASEGVPPWIRAAHEEELEAV